MERQGFAHRKPTHIAQNAEVNIEIVASFVEMVNTIKQDFSVPDHCMVNMDQTNVPFDIVHNRTIAKKGGILLFILLIAGSRTVNIRFTGLKQSFVRGL